MTTRFIRPLLLTCLLIVAGSLLSACGKKGALYIAPDAPADKPATEQQDKAKKSRTDNKNDTEAK